MIDAVSINGTAPVQAVQSSTSRASAPESHAPAKKTNQSFLSSRIRVDNVLNLAILEVRSHETGDVIRQFPTEGQIQSFQHAAELAEVPDKQTSESVSPVNLDSTVKSGDIKINTPTQTTQSSESSATNTTSNITPTPSPAPSTTNLSASSTQSIVV